MGMKEGEGVPVHELRGFAAWKAQIRNLLVKIDEDVEATSHKTRERLKSLGPLAERVSQHKKHHKLKRP